MLIAGQSALIVHVSERQKNPRSLNNVYEFVDVCGGRGFFYQGGEFAGKQTLKNREAGFGPASHRLAETFSLKWSLSSPQQPNAVGGNFNRNLKFVNAKKLAK